MKTLMGVICIIGLIAVIVKQFFDKEHIAKCKRDFNKKL